MTVGGHRPERLAEEIHHEISLMLAGELADPRLAAVTSVTEVRLTPDMRTVRTYVELSGDEAEREKALEGLRAAAGFVRHELTERLRLRRSPEVLFVPDTSEEYGHRIDELLKKVKEK
ncbi:MAG TPA: 30S ribosome-binding factor RbfA [Candidatus Acidoferrum sp.]|jgi:ribosome-binding factor A|nr:30S ribosome-binding factor RbfA [Candidatus Acidoferrum sp.]